MTIHNLSHKKKQSLFISHTNKNILKHTHAHNSLSHTPPPNFIFSTKFYATLFLLIERTNTNLTNSLVTIIPELKHHPKGQSHGEPKLLVRKSALQQVMIHTHTHTHITHKDTHTHTLMIYTHTHTLMIYTHTHTLMIHTYPTTIIKHPPNPEFTISYRKNC